MKTFLVGALFVLLTACGSAVSGYPPVKPAGVPVQRPAVAAPAPSVAPMPDPSGPAAAPVPHAPAATSAPTAQPAPPVQAPPSLRGGTFPLVPFGMRGAIGSVMVTAQGGGFAVSVGARNLAPGSAHTVHLHAGSCVNAYFGRHLLVLGTMGANGTGAGGVSTSLRFPYSTGRYVIVYANLNANTIIGCADLGAI